MANKQEAPLPARTPYSELPQAHLRALTQHEVGKFEDNLRAVLAHGLESGGESQKAIAALIHDGHVRITQDASLALNGDMRAFKITLTIRAGKDVAQIQWDASIRNIIDTEQFIWSATKATRYPSEQLVFSVKYADADQQKLFLHLLAALDIQNTNDVAFTDALALYLNINYQQFFDPTRPSQPHSLL